MKKINYPAAQYLTKEYISKNPTWDIEDSPWKARVVEAILKKNKLVPSSICEVGCGAGGCLAALRDSYPEIGLAGYDIAPEAAQFWTQYEDLNIKFEVNDFIQQEQSEYDVLMLLDVIEHLQDPYNFLIKLHGKAQYYVFHIPLDLSALSVFRETPLLYVRNKVGHIHYYTKQLALSLLNETGYAIIDCSFSGTISISPSRTWKASLARPLRNMICIFLGKDRGVRLVGGETLIVLAKSKE